MTQIKINRAPFLTLWASVVATRLGYNPDEASTLGQAVAGLTAHSKGKRLGIYGESSEQKHRELEARRRGIGAKTVSFMGREVPCVDTEDGLRALKGADPVDPGYVDRYLRGKFKEHLDAVREKLTALAETYEPDELHQEAMNVYMRLRPNVPKGREGWGRAGLLDTDAIDRLIRNRTS
jgi:hypothetical protein